MGIISTFWQVDQPSSNVLYSSTWTAASSIPFTTLRVYVFPEYGYGVGAYWKINGVTMPNQTGSAGWYTPTGVGSSLSTIELTAKNNGSTYEYGRLYAIEINGVILVDSSIVGAGNDSLVDCPTNGSQTDTGAGGEVVGNYCTWNPLNKGVNTTLANGNLDCTWAANFGQRSFAYTAPSGFKALCTTNLPEPTIADGSTAMDVALYTGNGSTQTISGLNFSPDFLWIKACRTQERLRA
jgi:hypothetical protein